MRHGSHRVGPCRAVELRRAPRAAMVQSRRRGQGAGSAKRNSRRDYPWSGSTFLRRHHGFPAKVYLRSSSADISCTQQEECKMAGRPKTFTDAEVREIRDRAHEIRSLGGTVSPSKFSHEYWCSAVAM